MSNHPSSAEKVAGDRLRSAESEHHALMLELEHASRLATLGTIAAEIAHEINNILTPVLAYAQLAANAPSDQKLQIKAINKTIQGVETASEIVRAMLGFSKTADQTAAADVKDVLRLTLDCLARDPAKDRINLVTRIEPGTSVRMRPLALQQILMNLILNASNAMIGRGGGELTFSAGPSGSEDVRIVLSDNGPGIAAEVLPRLFEPFTGSGGGRLPLLVPAGRRGGAGLGLSICKRLIDEANGSITVQSVVAQGTTFTITLPNALASRAKTG